ncbi:MAG: oxidoreductase [Pirellula sp.]|nr:oxidoreductase [Pirellula sp.]
MFDRRSYAVKEHVGVFKLTDKYDIFDGETGTKLGCAVENVGVVKMLLRLVVNKQLLPTTVEIRETDDGPAVLSIHRGFSLFRPTIDVKDGTGQVIGSFKSKLFTLGGGFYVYDAAGNQSAEVKGNWKGFTFQFLAGDGRELGTVTKKWGGLMKEMFTSADSYHIQLAADIPTQSALAALLLAAGLAIDIVFKERG